MYEQYLIYIVVLVVAVLIVLALVRWMGWNIPPVAMQIAGYIIAGIIIVILIRLLWPLLVGGALGATLVTWV